MLSLLLIGLSVIIGSACLSIIEAALLSLPLLRARMLVEKNVSNAKILLKIKKKIHITIASIVIVNNAINISGSVFIGQKVTELYGDMWLGASAAILTFFLIVFGEVIPKTLGEKYKVTVSLVMAPPIYALTWVLEPVVHMILSLERLFSKSAHMPVHKVTEEEIKMMIKLGHDAGTVEMDEAQLCTRVFKLNDVRAQQIMRPIDKIYAIAGSQTLKEAKKSIIDSLYSRIAVYDENPKDIVGVVQQRILLRELAKDNDDRLVRDFMFEPIFVHQLMKADTLLEKFQQTHQHLFIVQDNIGNDVGIVTMEDVLEELFGEIFDEKEIQPEMHFESKKNNAKKS